MYCNLSQTGYPQSRRNVSVNPSNAVDKGTSHPQAGYLVPSYIVSGLQCKKMERRLLEGQVSIGVLREQVVFKVEETAQPPRRNIRHEIKEPVFQAGFVFKDVHGCKRDSRKLVRYSSTCPGCVSLQDFKIGQCFSLLFFGHGKGNHQVIGFALQAVRQRVKVHHGNIGKASSPKWTCPSMK